MGTITTALCNSFKHELLKGLHDFDTDTFTLRATDRSIVDPIDSRNTIPNKDGRFIEWDIPIIVPESNIPWLRNADCRCVVSGNISDSTVKAPC